MTYTNENVAEEEVLPDDPVIGTGRGATRLSNIAPAQNQLDALIASLAQNASDVSTLKSQITGAVSGSPVPVTLASQMTNHARNYVYLGTESGYTSGNLYYYNGSSFINSGKQYQSTGVADGSITPKSLDRLYTQAETLTVSGTDISITDSNIIGNCKVIVPSSTTVYSHGKNYQKFQILSINSQLTNVQQTSDTITVTLATGKQYADFAMTPVYLKAGTYAFHREFSIISGSGTGNIGWVYIYNCDANGSTIGGAVASIGASANTSTYTVPSDGYYKMDLYANMNGTVTTDITIKFFNIQIEKSSGFTSYEIYKGEVQTGTNLIYNAFSGIGFHNIGNVSMTVSYYTSIINRLNNLETTTSTINNNYVKQDIVTVSGTVVTLPSNLADTGTVTTPVSTTVYSHGKNLQPFVINNQSPQLTNVTTTADSVTATVPAGNQYLEIDLKPVYLKAGTYSFHREFQIISGSGTGNIGFVYIYASNGTNQTGSPLTSIQVANNSVTFTVPSDGYYVMILYPNMTGTVTSDLTIKFFNIQIEMGNAYSYYEKYNGQILTGTNLTFNLFDGIGFYNSNNATMTINYSTSLTKRVSALENAQTRVVNCWGDSLTAGVGGNGTSYPSVLKNNLGSNWTVNNLGIGGEKTQAIAGRQGGIPLYVSPFTIPADTTATQITLNSLSGNSVTLNDVVGVNPCYIGDIQGTLSISNGNFYFTRSMAGTSKIVSNPTMIVTNAMKSKNKNDCIVIWMGTNGDWWDTSQDISGQWLCQQIQSMIDFSGTRNYLVIGMTSQPSDTQTAVDKWMTRYFGGKFIKLRDYLINYGLSDAGITPTAQDTTDIANGTVPTSLRYDSVHYLAVGYAVIGNLIYKRGHELGYW